MKIEILKSDTVVDVVVIALLVVTVVVCFVVEWISLESFVQNIPAAPIDTQVAV
jgi:hypothetical protein